VLISIDTWTQQMTVFVDGAPRHQWVVSTGADGYATPAGSFRPFRMEAEHYSREWDNAPMPYSIFFTDAGHAIHGTPHVKSLGAPMSHGCVRLAPKNAAKLFALVQAQGLEETRVEIIGSDWQAAQRLEENNSSFEIIGDGPKPRFEKLDRWLSILGG
jgi:lipoprotein-anchoring transpeptidase ErfK/SrfK